MGVEYSIAKSNDFKVKNFDNFKNGLKGYIGGDREEALSYSYSDVKRRSRNALIDIHSESFSLLMHKEIINKELNTRRMDYDDNLDTLEYIKEHILEGETCIIHHVSYESASDMSIYIYEITSEGIKETTITE